MFVSKSHAQFLKLFRIEFTVDTVDILKPKST